MNALHVFRQGLVVGREDFRNFWNVRTWFSSWMLRIASGALLWVLVGRLLGSEEKLQFLLIGNAVIAGPIAVGMVIPMSTWSRFEGTYPLLVVAPASMVAAQLGRTAIWWLHGVGTSLATFALLGLCFDLPLPLRAAGLLPLIALVCASTQAFSLTLGGFVNWVPALRNALQNSVMPLLMAVCGVSVPVTFWPAWLQRIATVLPVTHGLHAARALLAGEPAAYIVEQAALELAVFAGWLSVAVLSMDWLASLGRQNGTIELS